MKISIIVNPVSGTDAARKRAKKVVLALEEEFNITVPEEDAVNIKTVGDIINLIEKNQ